MVKNRSYNQSCWKVMDLVSLQSKCHAKALNWSTE